MTDRHCGHEVVALEPAERQVRAGRPRANGEIGLSARDQLVELSRQNVPDFDLQPGVQLVEALNDPGHDARHHRHNAGDHHAAAMDRSEFAEILARQR
jgi:hypothetical protein